MNKAEYRNKQTLSSAKIDYKILEESYEAWQTIRNFYSGLENPNADVLRKAMHRVKALGKLGIIDIAAKQEGVFKEMYEIKKLWGEQWEEGGEENERLS